MRRVNVVIWPAVRLNLITPGLFVPRNCTHGNWLTVLLSTMNEPANQLLMRTSDGCMVVILSAFKNPVGVPSHSPSFQM